MCLIPTVGVVVNAWHWKSIAMTKCRCNIERFCETRDRIKQVVCASVVRCYCVTIVWNYGRCVYWPIFLEKCREIENVITTKCRWLVRAILGKTDSLARGLGATGIILDSSHDRATFVWFKCKNSRKGKGPRLFFPVSIPYYRVGSKRLIVYDSLRYVARI